jgi:Mg-chelatase subunit ChlD
MNSYINGAGVSRRVTAANGNALKAAFNLHSSAIMNVNTNFKPKKVGTSKHSPTHVVFVLDDSASMRDTRDATISGFNEFLATQKENKERTFVSLYKFDGDSVQAVFKKKDVNQVRDLNRESYNPDGMTNLYDAIGSVMNKVNRQLAKSKKKDRETVMICILTDGAENSSREFDSNTVKSMVELAEGSRWGFLFLGANINAFSLGQTLGFRADNTMQYDMGNISQSMNTASKMSARTMSSVKSGADMNMAYSASAFTDAERKEAVKK